MTELLLELFSEEIPARMQAAAKEQLTQLFQSKIGLEQVIANTYVTPRRLVLHTTNLPLTIDKITEKKGPRKSAPEQAIQGFLKSTNLSLDQLELRLIDGEEYYFAVIKHATQKMSDLLAGLVPEILKEFWWPKSMRWGNYEMRWVRPLKNIACLFDGHVLPIKYEHLEANNQSVGHRFMGNGAFCFTSFAEYNLKLKAQFVILDDQERKSLIARNICLKADELGLNLHEDNQLLDEVTGLVEWPVVLIGKIDQDFLSIPQEVLTTSMRTHQKYFSLLNQHGQLAPYFVVVANIATQDNGKQIIAGNERVLRARLSDAAFFWQQDLKSPLEAEHLTKVKNMMFHAKLGSMADKIERMSRLATLLPGTAELSQRAILLCKADLSTRMVGEFPELQGIMGSYYAAHNCEPAEVVDAIKNHYKPLGPNDYCPNNLVSATVAIADKLDTIAGMFAINEKPTGSKDPFALRRAALGIVRILLENNINIDLSKLVEQALALHSKPQLATEILEFFTDRLTVFLKNQDVKHDIIKAVLASSSQYDICQIRNKAHALQHFLASEAGVEMLAIYRRAANIVLQAEKKEQTTYTTSPDVNILQENEEQALLTCLTRIKPQIEQYIAQDQYVDAINMLKDFRVEINNFFDKVLVNVDDQQLRYNRLLLLAEIRNIVKKIADFSLIEGAN